MTLMYPQISDWTTFQIELAAQIYVRLASDVRLDALKLAHNAKFSISAANIFAQAALEAFEDKEEQKEL